MNTVVPTLNKDYADSLQFPKCPICGRHYEQLSYRQRYCQDILCIRIRRNLLQVAYRQKKKEATV
jgi:hypothetical protein